MMPHLRFIRTLVAAFALTMALSVTGVPAADLSIYADTLTSGWADWSWDTAVDVTNPAPVQGGTSSLAVRFNAAWAGLSLHTDSAVSTGGNSKLRFWINGGATGNQLLRIVVNGNANATFPVTAPANAWQEILVPLSAVGSPASVSDIYWQESTGAPQPLFYLDDISLISASLPSAEITLSVDAGTGRHPISPDIYGMNFVDEQLAAELRLPVRRWGGNSTTRYNWQANLHNTASDWYFENYPDGAAVTDGSASDLFVEQDRRTGTKTLITVPLMGWTPRSDAPRACGFSVAKYGPQQSVDNQWQPNCGNGITTGGAMITDNSPTDTSSAITPTFVTGWLAHLTGRYGTATDGGVAYYNLDNEPMLWNSTHRDVHPEPTSYDEIRDRTWQYGAAIKSADPSARTLGPTVWGWCAYFYSALDGCSSGTDYLTHGGTPFVPWYLQQMKGYEQLQGVRILDYLDLHYYPQASGVALSSAGSTATQAQRLRSTRSLWDPSYVDESWINDSVRLIPRMHEWSNSNYPGTKLAITEYNWGGLESINGALAQADVLGIFGREGLDLATLWAPPLATDPGAFAFRIYRNYDGAGHGFGETTTQSTSSAPNTLALYSAQRSSDNALTVVVINKSSGDVAGTVALSGFLPRNVASVYRYSPENLSTIKQLADQPVTAQGFGATFPVASITLYVIPPSVPPTFTVTFTSNGGSAVASQSITAGNSATTPPPPTRSGYSFAGWYTDAGLTSPFSFSTTIVADMTLYAGWTVTAPPPIPNMAWIITLGYPDFAKAYAAASGAVTTIKLREGTLLLGTVINKGLVLAGGYQADLSRSSDGFTALLGIITIGTGSMTADRIIVK